MSQSPLDPALTRSPLGRDQITSIIQALTEESRDVVEKAAFLTALAQRGESADEIAGFAHELRERAPGVEEAAAGGDHQPERAAGRRVQAEMAPGGAGEQPAARRGGGLEGPDVPLRPDKQVDRNRCDKCGAVVTSLYPHKNEHLCIKCKIKLI